jgi:glyoxylase-like metal-dependent hydrolase (beta-lactamase superfamily II)
VLAGLKKNDTVFWVESQRAVISGDTLGDFGRASRSTRAGSALA